MWYVSWEFLPRIGEWWRVRGIEFETRARAREFVRNVVNEGAFPRRRFRITRDDNARVG